MILALQRTSRFLRLAAAGATVAIPLLGAVTARGTETIGVFAGIAAVGLAHHIFSFVLNDVVDKPIDMTEPRRSASPLVQGLISTRGAVAIASTAGILGFVLALWLGASLLALTLLVSSYVLIAVYDVWGKKCPLPPVTDVIQGVGWALLAWYGAEMVGGATPATAVFGVFLVGYIALANGIHGGLRDLENDRAHGAKTTAIWLGATPQPGGAARSSRTLDRYAIALETWNTFVVLMLILSLGYGGWTLVYALTAWLVLASISQTLLRKALGATADRRKMMVLGTSHLVVSFAVAVAVLIPVAPTPIAVFVLVVYVSPLLTYGWLFDALLRAPTPRSAR